MPAKRVRTRETEDKDVKRGELTSVHAQRRWARQIWEWTRWRDCETMMIRRGRHWQMQADRKSVAV